MLPSRRRDSQSPAEQSVETARHNEPRPTLAKARPPRGSVQALSTVRGISPEGVTMPDLDDAPAVLENLGDERMRAEFAAVIKFVRDCIPQPVDGLVSVD